jgi:hypothetical protein
MLRAGELTYPDTAGLFFFAGYRLALLTVVMIILFLPFTPNMLAISLGILASFAAMAIAEIMGEKRKLYSSRNLTRKFSKVGSGLLAFIFGAATVSLAATIAFGEPDNSLKYAFMQWASALVTLHCIQFMTREPIR